MRPTSFPPGNHDDMAIRTGYPGIRLVLMNEPGSELAMDSYVAESPNRSSRGLFATYAASTAEATATRAMT
jgi:hypothetical protein